MMKLIRFLLGTLIIWWDRLTPPSALQRSSEDQALVDQATQSLSLYQFAGCPFCVKVRREAKRLGVQIELRDAQVDGKHRDDLKKLGGHLQVPCLRISGSNDGASPLQDQWLYESNDIIAYLRDRFSSPTAPLEAYENYSPRSAPLPVLEIPQ